jgi:hypothetical protein
MTKRKWTPEMIAHTLKDLRQEKLDKERALEHTAELISHFEGMAELISHFEGMGPYNEGERLDEAPGEGDPGTEIFGLKEAASVFYILGRRHGREERKDD